jgi:hypothetical protein
MIEYIPGANKRQKAARAKLTLAAKFKFWYEIKSGSQLATEFMNINEASDWLLANQQVIVGIQIIERMSKDEVLKIIKGIGK